MRRLGALATALGAALAAAVLVAAPAVARPNAAARAAHYLTRAQNRDGGFGEAPRTGSSALYAGWAALGLASAGVSPGRLRAAPGRPTLLAYVARGAGARDPGSLERTILVARAAGADPSRFAGRDLVTELTRRFSARGSIGGLVNLTAFGLLALRAAGQPSTVALQARAARWLVSHRDRDGGYEYAGRGGPSDADDTGAVLEALAGSRVRGASLARRGAVAYLRRDEGRDGGFPAGPGQGSNAQSTAWAIQGLLAAGVNPDRVHRDGHTPLGYLRSLQSASGAVRYARGETATPVWVTAEALLAFTRTPLPLVTQRTASPRSGR